MDFGVVLQTNPPAWRTVQLAELSEAYESAAARVQLGKDVDWWHKANALWHASREYQRRHAGCDALSKRLSSKHSPEQLATMQMEY